MAIELEALETPQVCKPMMQVAGAALHQGLDSRPSHGGGGRHGDAGAWGPQQRWTLLEGGLRSKLSFVINNSQISHVAQDSTLGWLNSNYNERDDCVYIYLVTASEKIEEELRRMPDWLL